MIDEKKRIFLIIDINSDLKREVKVLAARRNISMSLWVTRAIYDYIKKERLYDNE